jgi:multiple sugar transport system substrate-binding protein
MTTLRGITWGHTRGYAPLVVASEIYMDLGSPFRIEWDKRSLTHFGEGPLEQIAAEYDVIMVDHPWIGHAARGGLFLPLDDLFDAAFLDELAGASVGPSYRSYVFEGRPYALPTDAACQASVARTDLLAASGHAWPTSWDEVLELARATGKVAAPLTPVNALSAWFTLCANFGSPAFGEQEGLLVEEDVARRALAWLAELFELVGPDSLTVDPIALLNRMSSTDEVLYAPFSYSYSNYARAGFAPTRLAFRDIPTLDPARPGGAIVGGVGWAICAASERVEEAVAFARWLHGAECQSSTYVLAGGQPGRREAWQDPVANAATNGFFEATLGTMDRGFLRPNYHGFEDFQNQAKLLLADCLRGETDHDAFFGSLRSLYETTRVHAA